MKKVIEFLTNDEDLRIGAQLVKATIGAGALYMWMILLASMGK